MDATDTSEGGGGHWTVRRICCDSALELANTKSVSKFLLAKIHCFTICDRKHILNNLELLNV